MVCRAAHSGHNAQLEQRLEQGSNVSQALIAALQNPALYPHPVEGFQLIETHISWVLLTGPYAYKVKKPVNFGFLDFTSLDAGTLERRLRELRELHEPGMPVH